MPNLTLQIAEQYFRVLQMFATSLDDKKAMEVAYIYDPWEIGKAYAVDEFVTYGVNDVGDPQMYKVVQTHIAQADWTPNTTPALYKAIGLDEDGHPVWSQPAGAHDAYQKGDVVNYQGVLYRSEIDGNIYSPETYAEVWTVYLEDIL